MVSCVFFFQAEDGIRDLTVTGVQTCALPISGRAAWQRAGWAHPRSGRRGPGRAAWRAPFAPPATRAPPIRRPGALAGPAAGPTPPPPAANQDPPPPPGPPPGPRGAGTAGTQSPTT